MAFPVAAAAGGALLSARRPPGPKATSGLQHLAAGVVVAATAGELLPDLKHKGQLGAAVIGFTIGVAVMLALQEMERRAAKRPTLSTSVLPISLLVAVGIDLLIDGILVGLGASLGARQGLILTVALTLEIGFLALVVTNELAESTSTRLRAAGLACALSFAVVVGALLAVLVLADARPSVVAAVLAGGVAALLFLVTEELISEAHEGTADTPLLAGLFFAGFLALYALEGVGG